jgi:hypothetical protein
LLPSCTITGLTVKASSLLAISALIKAIASVILISSSFSSAIFRNPFPAINPVKFSFSCSNSSSVNSVEEGLKFSAKQIKLIKGVAASSSTSIGIKYIFLPLFILV